MQQIKTFLSGKKTYLLAVSSLIAVAIGWSDGKLDNLSAIQQAIALLLAIFIRNGISANKPS